MTPNLKTGGAFADCEARARGIATGIERLDDAALCGGLPIGAMTLVTSSDCDAALRLLARALANAVESGRKGALILPKKDDLPKATLAALKKISGFVVFADDKNLPAITEQFLRAGFEFVAFRLCASRCGCDFFESFASLTRVLPDGGGALLCLMDEDEASARTAVSDAVVTRARLVIDVLSERKPGGELSRLLIKSSRRGNAARNYQTSIDAAFL